MIRPDVFLSVKVVKSTMEFIRLEGEVENKSKLPLLMMKLDSKTIKLSGFTEALKVRVAEAKVNFPVRHDWDSYFRDAKHMNELKPGERPDTIHLKDLPTRWFAKRSPNPKDKSKEEKHRPSEEILRKVFETFGEVRAVDIPMLDPYRKEIMGSLAKPGTIQTFNYGQDLTFEAFVQFKEYISFVKAMDALRGMKLLYKEDEDKALTANIKVDFDKSRHLCDKMIRKRRIEREKLEALERVRQEEVQRERQEEERKREAVRLKKLEGERLKQQRKEEKQRQKEERRKEREEKRRQKYMDRKQKEEEERMQLKISLEERRLLIAQRKLESLRLLSELFERVKDDKVKEEVAKQEKEVEEKRRQEVLEAQRRRLEEERQKAEAKIQKKLQMRQQEVELREKILKNVTKKEQQEQDKQREELRQKLSGTRRLKSAVIMKQRVKSILHGDDEPAAPKIKKEPKSPKDDDKEQKEEKLKLSDVSDDEDDNKNRDKDAQKKKKKAEDDDDGIELITSSDEDEPPAKKNKKPSALEKVLQRNKLRAWGAPDDDVASVASFKMPAPKRMGRRVGDSKKLLIVKRLENKGRRKDDEDDGDSSDSGDSTITIIPPPKSTFAPPDDPAAMRPFMGPPGFPMPPPWAFPPPPGMMPPPWVGPPPPGYPMPPRPPWDFQGPRGRGNFHVFKASYLKKYNFSQRGPISYKLAEKLSTKKDVEGRFMYPLT